MKANRSKTYLLPLLFKEIDFDIKFFKFIKNVHIRDTKKKYNDCIFIEMDNNKEIEYSEFNKDKSKKDGYRSNCSLCRVASLKKYYLTNKDSIIQYKNEYYAHNIEEILNKKKKYDL